MKINNNFFCIIEARLSSVRLPNKVLKNLTIDQKVIDFVINNLLNSRINKKNILLAIPKNKKNHELYYYVKNKYKLNIFQGSENNVYKRVYDCCKKNKVKDFIRITADNIFLDPILINKAIELYLRKKLTYLSTRTMDHSYEWNLTSDYNEGNSIEIINTKNFFNIKKKVTKKDCEYPTWHLFSNPKNFNLTKFYLIKEYKKILSKNKIKKIRTTLDTRKDFQFLLKIIQTLNLKAGTNNFLKILKNYSKIKKFLKINQSVKKKIAYQVVKKNKLF